jgi:hypothetical protein
VNEAPSSLPSSKIEWFLPSTEKGRKPKKNELPEKNVIGEDETSSGKKSTDNWIKIQLQFIREKFLPQYRSAVQLA